MPNDIIDISKPALRFMWGCWTIILTIAIFVIIFAIKVDRSMRQHRQHVLNGIEAYYCPDAKLFFKIKRSNGNQATLLISRSPFFSGDSIIFSYKTFSGPTVIFYPPDSIVTVDYKRSSDDDKSVFNVKTFASNFKMRTIVGPNDSIWSENLGAPASYFELTNFDSSDNVHIIQNGKYIRCLQYVNHNVK